jgi:hypothetical protein
MKDVPAGGIGEAAGDTEAGVRGIVMDERERKATIPLRELVLGRDPGHSLLAR